MKLLDYNIKDSSTLIYSGKVHLQLRVIVMHSRLSRIPEQPSGDQEMAVLSLYTGPMSLPIGYPKGETKPPRIEGSRMCFKVQEVQFTATCMKRRFYF